ncbi:hypothetical protein [Mariniphaga sediminis]|uniref:hypothetical protein n=1 Tax=Mariniphaga sediminis TaxID=1628158 RepID=UPI0035691BF8
MVLTLELLFNDASVIKSVIDRVMQTKWDSIYWKRYLDFEQTMSRTFKTYLGTVTGVTAGSVIDRNSNKPIRQRRSLGSGIGEIAYLGDKYQMDNDRLDALKSLIDKYNQAKTADQVTALNNIINYIVDDIRQVLLAPHKRMDVVVGALRSIGKAEVKLADNPQGIELIDIELPFKFVTPLIASQTNFITYLKEQIEALKASYGIFSVMEMSRSTFNKYIVGSAEFGTNYKMLFGTAELAQSGGLITDSMVNQVFSGIGLPPIRIVEEYVAMPDGTTKQIFTDKRVTLLPSDKVGKMMWHEPYEASDPVPGKTYTRSEGGMYISQIRTDEGRFMEYGAEWIPNFTAPNKIVNFDLKNFS